MSPNYDFEFTWMLSVFSLEIWCLIIVFYIVSTFFSIVGQNFSDERKSQFLMTTMFDHFFYSFGALCNQGYNFYLQRCLFEQTINSLTKFYSGDVLYLAHENSKILCFCIGMYTWVLIQSYSSMLYIVSASTDTIPPFNSLESLFYKTKYTILATKNSIVDTVFMVCST